MKVRSLGLAASAIAVVLLCATGCGGGPDIPTAIGRSGKATIPPRPTSSGPGRSVSRSHITSSGSASDGGSGYVVR